MLLSAPCWESRRLLLHGDPQLLHMQTLQSVQAVLRHNNSYMTFLLAEFGQKIVAAQMTGTVVAVPIASDGGRCCGLS